VSLAVSYAILIFNFGGASPPPFEDLQERHCRPLGSAEEVRGLISAHLAGIDWISDTWGQHGSERAMLDVHLEERRPVSVLHLKIRGDAVPAIMAFARPLGWTVWDDVQGRYLDQDGRPRDP
jgi:hypothetical protein